MNTSGIFKRSAIALALGPSVVAKSDEHRALQLGEHGEVRELGDRPCPNEAEADRILRFQFLAANRRFGQPSFPDNRSLVSYDNSCPARAPSDGAPLAHADSVAVAAAH